MRNRFKLCANQRLLMRFAESGLDCVKLEDWPHKNARSLVASLHSTVKRLNLNVSVIRRGDDVFLVKNRIAEKTWSVMKGGDCFEKY